MRKQYRLRFYYTELQWKEIDKKIKQLGKSGLHSYLRVKIPSVASIAENCKECLDSASKSKVERAHYLQEDVFKQITDFAEKNGVKDPSVIIARLLIDPLLSAI